MRRDANIAKGGNPWPVLQRGVIGSDAVGEVIQVGDAVTGFNVGDRAAPTVDQANLTGREPGCCWLAADVDGVLVDHLAVDERLACKMPEYLDWSEASTLACAGVTAWTALKGVDMGSTIFIKGTGGVSMIALKLARASGCKVIISSSSDAKLHALKQQFSSPPLLTVNYAKHREWEMKVLQLTDGFGVDLVLENGGASSLVQSIEATRRGGTISQAGYLPSTYLGKQDLSSLEEFVPLLIDRRVVLRGINCGSKHELEDFCTAVAAMQTRFRDIIDTIFPFERANEAVEHVLAE